MARIALIDADEEACAPLVAWLSELGHNVRPIRDGSVALDTIRSEPFELIILCVEIPHLSGYTLCNKLKRDQSVGHVPLLLVSSLATVETFEEHKRLRTRADAYAHKPFDLAELAPVFAELLGGHAGAGLAGQTAVAPFPADPKDSASPGRTKEPAPAASRLGEDPSVYDISSSPFLGPDQGGADGEPEPGAREPLAPSQPPWQGQHIDRSLRAEPIAPADRGQASPRDRRPDDAAGPAPHHLPHASAEPDRETAPTASVDLLASTQVYALADIEAKAAPADRATSRARSRARRNSKEGEPREAATNRGRARPSKRPAEGADADFLGQTRAALAELAAQVATLERERDALRASEQALQEKVAEHRSMALSLGEQVAAQKERVATLELQIAAQQAAVAELTAGRASAEASANQLRRGLTALLNSGS